MANSNSNLDTNQAIRFLLINLLIAASGPWFIRIFGNFWDHAVFYVLGALVLALFDRSYGRVHLWGAYFIAFLVFQIILSSINIAWLVIQPRLKLDPGIVAVPLTVSTGLEITMLASAITLTPGTLSVDLGYNDKGQQVLFVHNLTVGDPDEFRNSIHEGFERLILRTTRGD
ncbi:MAG: Na+/H+ antiporter subunit E [Chloroflexota bacterium]|nr:Na+/H+ antiporter subunit E [Chloroflexota bacterium]